MRHFAHVRSDRRSNRFAALRLLTGLFLVLLWVCAGCGGGEKETTGAADGGSRLVPAGTLDAAADSVGQAGDTTAVAEGTASAPEAEAAGPAETAATGAAVAEKVVAPAAATTPPPAPAKKTAAPATRNLQTGGEYSLQLGSFRARSNAEARAQLVRDTGYAPEIVSVQVGEYTYHRVQIRGLADRSTAERVGAELKDLLGIDYLVKKSG